jgi:HSP20 family protein
MRYDITKNSKRNSLFDVFFGDSFFSPVVRDSGEGVFSWAPAVDIVEKEDKYILKADLPGVDEKDVNIELKDNVLTIRGERKSEMEEEKENMTRCERTYGAFSRSFNVYDIAEDRIDASYNNGILTVELPKKEETKPRRIEIKMH